MTGIYLWSGGLTTPKMWIDDLPFSNSLTVEHNTIEDGNKGVFVRSRKTNPSTLSASDTWPHHDPTTGIVVSVSGQNGNQMEQLFWDANQNKLQSWSTGLWSAATAADGDRWRHMRYDADLAMWMGSIVIPEEDLVPPLRPNFPDPSSASSQIGPSCSCALDMLQSALEKARELMKEYGFGVDAAQAQCIANQLQGGMDITCMNCNDPRNPEKGGYATRFGTNSNPTKRIVLCSNKLDNWPLNRGDAPCGWGLVMIHEAAHSCGWKHGHGGVPGDDETVGQYDDIPKYCGGPPDWMAY